MGLGKGQSGVGGSGYFLLMILFVELFGVTMGQVSEELEDGGSIC